VVDGSDRYVRLLLHPGSQQADALGRLDAWPRLLQFLADLRAGT
jgi:hypothetical protein